MVGHHVGERKARHGHHLVVQLLQLADTGVAVGDKLPIGIRHGQITQTVALLLQTLDTQGWQSIWIEAAPNEGIGRALNDRLARAAHVDLRN